MDAETEAMIADLRRQNAALVARVTELERQMRRYVLPASITSKATP